MRSPSRASAWTSSFARPESLSWDVEASIGDSDPVIALQDGIRAFSPDEVLIVTRPDEEAGWLEDDFFERAQAGEHPPMTHVVIGEDKRVEEVEEVDAGPGDPKETEADPDSRNLPRYSTRDIAGIVVAVAGSIALIAIAAACPGRIAESGGTDTACTIELLIAGAISLINVGPCDRRSSSSRRPATAAAGSDSSAGSHWSARRLRSLPA